MVSGMELAMRDQYSAEELLQAQAHVWNHIFSFINSMSLKCAVQMGILDIIHFHNNTTLSELATLLKVHPTKTSSLYRLMRVLAHSGFVRANETDRAEEETSYQLTIASRLLLRGEASSVVPLLLLVLGPNMSKPWEDLCEWFRNDDMTAFQTAHDGVTVWEYASRVPKFNHLVNEAMAGDSGLVASIIVDKCGGVFRGLSSLVDVGGGTGTVAKALVSAFPHLECTVFDLPHVVANLRGSDNLKYVGGDMFEKVPNADAVLLKWVLHDWNDEDSVKILKRCKEAITSEGRKGKVIIVDMVTESLKGDLKLTETQLFFDMEMTVMVGGRERKEKEWANLFSNAGFGNYKIAHILGLRSLIEVYP